MKQFIFIIILFIFAACNENGPMTQCKLTKGFHYDMQGNAGCLVIENDKMLLVRDFISGKLGPPGGGNEDHETAPCTAARETYEEAGLEVRVGQLLGTFGKGNFYLFRCYALKQPVSLRAPVPFLGFSEIEEVLWLDPNLTQAKDWRFTSQYDDMNRIFNYWLEQGRGL